MFTWKYHLIETGGNGLAFDLNGCEESLVYGKFSLDLLIQK